jgi:flagellar biosynthesis GTPase FlhF
MKRVYRGGSLEELLPRIREELGDDAVITRQREGIVGGVAGFFGRKCVEVEACAAAFVEDLVQPSVPGSLAAAAYEQADDEEILEEMAANPLMQALIDQSTPFAAHLASLLEDAEADGAEPEEPAEPQVVPVPPAQAVAEPAADPMPAEPAEPAPLPDREAGVLEHMVAAGLPRPLCREIVDEAVLHGGALAPREPFTAKARRGLARRIPVRSDFPGLPHVLALVGIPGAGRTSVAARLAGAYAAAGSLRVAALSLEEDAAAAELAGLLAGSGAHVEAAHGRAAVSEAAARLRRSHDLVVVDTPPAPPGSPGALEELARLVGAAAPDTVHAVVPATFPHAAGALLDALAATLPVDRIVLGHVDAGAAAGAALELALARELPVSYVSSGPARADLALADPLALARLVLP